MFEHAKNVLPKHELTKGLVRLTRLPRRRGQRFSNRGVVETKWEAQNCLLSLQVGCLPILLRHHSSFMGLVFKRAIDNEFVSKLIQKSPVL